MEPGGFLQPHLPSPPQSNRTLSVNGIILPATRSYPLKRGSVKESAVIDHLDGKLLEISRRYEKRFNPSNEGSSDKTASFRGYETFGEAAKDLEAVTDIVWVTGTPTLQTSYLLTIALSVVTYFPSFPFSPRPTFRILGKLDLAFASLLQGSNVETGEKLTGFEGLLGARGIDNTKRVRMRGIVERTRVSVVEIAAKHGSNADTESMYQTTSDEDTVMDDDSFGEDEYSIADRGQGNWDMEIARVYERTIVLLGESLEPSPSSLD